MDWNYGDILDAVAQVTPPARPAVIWKDRVLSWREFDRRGNNIARSLLDLGLKTDDKIAILCRNHPAYIEFLAAGVKARLLTVNINYRYTADEIDYVLDDSQSDAVFYQDSLSDHIPELKRRRPGVNLWVRIESDGRVQLPANGDHSFEMMATNGDGAALAVKRSWQDGYLLYTGGTTGRPKGVLWPTGAARTSQLESPLLTRVPQSLADHQAMVVANANPSRVIPACPLMHGSGSNAAMGDLLNGGTVIILPSDRFDAQELWREVDRLSATRVAIVGDVFAKPMLKALDDHRGAYDLSSLASISTSGLTMTSSVKARLLEHLPQIKISDILGASEASGFGFAVATKGHVQPTGLFEAGRQTVLVDADTGAILPKDQPVEGFLARSGAIAAGYFRDEAKTAETYRYIDGVRYAVPGDFARWTPPNQFVLIGRGNLSINTGGEKVFPEEVEEAIRAQPGIDDALVVGQPDERWGKIVVAIIRVSGAFDEAKTRAGLAKSLSAYKHPKRFVIVDEVPRHESGKADYRRAVALAGG